MKRCMKAAGILLCSTTMVLATASTSDACLLGWLFGCHCHRPAPVVCAPACPPPCPTPYAPAVPAVPTFYQPTFAPSVTAGYAPVVGYHAGYAPLDYSAGYAPLDFGTGYVPLDHSAGYVPQDSCASGTLPPVSPPPSSPPRTFENGGALPGPDAPGSDEQFRPREESPRFRPTTPDRKDDYDDKKAGATGYEEWRIPESIIPERRPAPARPPVEPITGSRHLASQSASPRIRPLGLDHKITWRTPPARTRLILRSNLEAPAVARTKAAPNAGWLPVVSEATVARK